MVIAVGNLYFVEQVAAIRGFVGVNVHDIEAVLVLRIGDDVHVVPGPLPQAMAGIDQLPRLPTVVRAVESTIRIVRLNQGIDALGVGGDGHANFSVWPLRQSMFFYPLPGCASIG